MSPRSEGRSAEYQEPSGPAGVRVVERRRTEVQEGEVAVAIRRASINHLDVFTTQGLQPTKPGTVICADGAGVVESSGSGRFRAGDEVVLFPTLADGTCAECAAGREVFCRGFGILGEHSDGTACELLHVPERMVYRKPDGISWDQAGAFPLTFLTAYRMLVTRAGLQAGETVLVVGAGAGVAVAAIIIAKALGATVFATSRSAAKLEKARQAGADEVFETAGFSNSVREATGKRGVDVVFEHVGPATLDDSVKSLANGGRLVFCGSTTGVKAEFNMPRLFFRHASLLGSTMGNSGEFEAVLDLVGRGAQPVVDQVFELDDVSRALAHLDSGEQFGKVVLRVSD